MRITQKYFTAASAACMVLAVFVMPTFGDLLELKDGRVVQGDYNGGTMTSIRFTADGVMRSYPTADITALVFEGPTVAPVAAPSVSQAPVVPVAPQPQPTAAPAAQTSRSGSVSVPAGTTLTVRMDSALSTRSHGAGHQFTATLEADLAVDGVVVAPRGTKVYGVLAKSDNARRLFGSSEMTIVLSKIALDGQLLPIATDPAQAVSSQPAGRQTLGRTARAAAIGGLIDGSDGAATGAKVGLGVSILTKGASVDVPKGTLLDFRLTAALAVNR